jgi:hypothetical protein
MPCELSARRSSDNSEVKAYYQIKGAGKHASFKNAKKKAGRK